MHYPDSRWRPRCQGKSRDDVSGRIYKHGLVGQSRIFATTSIFE